MCGIAGLIQKDVKLDFREHIPKLTEMPQKLIHRGPENLGTWADKKVFLSQTRLKILDLSAQANQPIFNEDQSVVLVFNGEIYNFKELRKDLIQKNHQFKSEGDTEVIVHLYEEYGLDCIARLDGMFAFSLWDRKKERLVLARDRTGKKPLFYYHDQSHFAFASEIKAFSDVKEIRLEKNEHLYPYYFLHGYIPTPQTFYKNIYSLEPAHALVLDAGFTPKKIKYWDPTDHYRQQRQISTKQAISDIRELTTQAIVKRLISDVPLGTFLSGGIDSTIISGIAATKVRHTLKTFSIGFEGDSVYDETVFANSAAKKFQTDHTVFHVKPHTLPEHIDQLVYQYDTPFGDSSCLPSSIVSQLAKEQVTVVLTGDGGDEVFGGYNRYISALWISRLPKRFINGISPVIKPLLKMIQHPKFSVPRWQKLQQSLGSSPLNSLIAYESYFYWDLEQLMRKDYLSPLNISKDFLYRPHLKDISGMSPLSAMLYLNLKTYLLDDLNVKMDRASMMHSLETRAPFLDYKLIEYCAALPDHLKIRGLKTKYILKEAYKDLLPSEIYKRPKAGFGVPLSKWFRGPLKSYIQDEFSDLSRLRPFLNTPWIEALLKAHLQGESDNSQKIWSLLAFKKWIEKSNV